MKYKTILICLILITLSSYVYAESQKVFILNLNYDNGVINKKSLIVSEGFFGNPQRLDGGYNLELISFTGEVLYKTDFEFSLVTFYDNFASNEGGVVENKESTKELIIPYYENAKLIGIYDREDKKIISIDISIFTSLCGDNICQENESFEICPEDCIKISKKWNKGLYGLIVIILIVLVYLLYRKYKP